MFCILLLRRLKKEKISVNRVRIWIRTVFNLIIQIALVLILAMIFTRPCWWWGWVWAELWSAAQRWHLTYLGYLLGHAGGGVGCELSSGLLLSADVLAKFAAGVQVVLIPANVWSRKQVLSNSKLQKLWGINSVLGLDPYCTGIHIQ